MKKNWYDRRLKWFVVFLVIGICLMIESFSYNPASIHFLRGYLEYEILGSLVIAYGLVLMVYPAYLFRKLAPKTSSNGSFNASPITQMLPVSKKQLFMQGIKTWVIMAPICLFIMLMIYGISWSHIHLAIKLGLKQVDYLFIFTDGNLTYLSEFWRSADIFKDLLLPLGVMLLFALQFIWISIQYFIKPLSAFSCVIQVIALNSVIVLMAIIIYFAVGKTNEMAVLFSCLAVVTVPCFSYRFKQIEKIYQ